MKKLSIPLILTGTLVLLIPIITNPFILFILELDPYSRLFFTISTILILVGIILGR